MNFSQRWTPSRIFPLMMIILIILTFSSATFSDQVILKGGTVISGKVIEKKDGMITVSVDGGGSMTLPENMLESIVLSPTQPPQPITTPSPTPISVLVIVPTATPTSAPPTETPAHSLQEVKSATREWTEAEIEKIGQGRKRFGRTQDTVGVVQVKRPGQNWEELPGDTFLFEGDELKTLQGRTKILLDRPTHQTEMRVNENSQLKIPQEEETSTVDLLRGKMWSRIKALSAAGEVKFQVRTPNAVAGVRGTLLYVEMLPQDVKVAVFEGNVLVYGRREPAQRTSIGQLKAVLVSKENDRLSSLLDVDPNEIKEWEEWDEWAKQTKADLAPYTAGVPGAKGIVEGQIDQIAAEGKLYSQMAAEGNRLVLRNRQSDHLESMKQSIFKYYQDLGHLPAEDRGLDYLQNNLDSTPRWQGPYLESQFQLPVRDLWKQEILYRIQTSEKSGKVYAELISSGPNRRFDEGRGDDIRVIIVPSE